MNNIPSHNGADDTHQVKVLRRRLAEAETLVEALLTGEIDAVTLPDTPPLILREAQQALRASEQTFRAVFEGAYDAMVIVDDAGRYVDANPAACELFGISKKGLLRRTIRDFALPDFDFETAWNSFQESERETGVFRLIRPDGTVRITEYSAATNFLPGRHLSIMRDVTVRKQIEEERQQALYELGERVKEATLLHRAGRILSERDTTIPEVLEEIATLIPPAWQYPAVAGARLTFGELMEATPNFTHTPWSQRVEFRTADGTSGTVEVSYLEAKPEVDEGPFLAEERNTLEALAHMLQSDLERREAEAALRLSELKYRTLFETMVQGVVYHDAEGNIVETNSAAARIFNRPREEIVSLTPDALPVVIDEEGNRLSTDELPGRIALRTGQPVQNVIVGVYCAHENDYRWVKAHSIPQFREGQSSPYQVYTTFEDITERKRTEEKLRESEEQYRLLADNTLDVIWSMNMELEFTYVNPAIARLSGHTPDGWVGTHLAHHFDETNLAKLVQVLQAEITKGEDQVGVIVEAEMRRKDGSAIPIEVHGKIVFDSSGMPESIQGTARDITRRKQREERVRFQAQLLDSVQEAVVAADLQGRIVYWGGGAERLLGCSREEALDQDYRTLVSRVDDIAPAARAAQLRAQGSWQGRMRTQRKDGRWVDADASLGLVRDETAAPIGYLAVLREVTEQVAHERELAAIAAIGQALRSAQGAEETYRITLEQVEQIFEADGTALSILNEAKGEVATAMATGIWQVQEGLAISPTAKLTGHIIEAKGLFTTRDLRTEVHVRLRDLIAEGTAAAAMPLIREAKVIGILWLARSAHFGRREQRVLEAISSVVAEAIQRAHLYERLRNQASQLQQIMESVDWGLLLLNEDRQIVLANGAAASYLPLLAGESAAAGEGYRLQQLGRVPLSRLLAPPDITSRHTLSLPERGREFSILAHPIEEARGWVLVLRDVTEERQIQQQMAQQDRLAAVGQLAAGIAHDFNNILSAIVLYSQIMQRDPGMEPANRERLGVIFSQTQHAADLVSQILDFSRRSVMERAAIDLVPLFKEWHKLWQRIFPENIHVDFQSASQDFIVNADPTRLHQALMNFVINARDAMPDGGRLSVGLNLVRLERGSPPPVPDMELGEWVAITIADTGTGIDHTVLSHIFEPFFTTKSLGKGTGLGLAQSHGIIQQHEGHIAVASQVEEGSTFTIYLPLLLQQGTVHPLPALRESMPVGAGETTILVVEDQEETRLAIEEALALIGYRVLAAGGGFEALEIMSEHQGAVDLVLTDMVMRDIGGMELMQQMQQQYAGVKTMLMTGYPLDAKSRSRLGEERLTWIQKPFMLDELIDKIEGILQGSDS